MSEKTFSVNSELLNNCCEESNSVGQDDLHDKITSPVDRNMSDQANKRHHDVFISYASENKTVADAIVADFEQNGIRCWYAPRDIRAGENYMDALIGAIEEAWVVVLVYSEESNQSKYVLNEVTAAFEAGKTIVPFRLTDTQMRRALSFCLNNVHWMDATTPPLAKNIAELREHMCAIIPDIHKTTTVSKTQSLSETVAQTSTGNPIQGHTMTHSQNTTETPSQNESEKHAVDEPIPWWPKYRIPLAIAVAMIIGLFVWNVTRTPGTQPGKELAEVNPTEESQKEDGAVSVETAQKEGEVDSSEEEKHDVLCTMSRDKFLNWVGENNFKETIEIISFRDTLENAPGDATDLSENVTYPVLGWSDGTTLYLAGEGGVKAPSDCNYLFSAQGARDNVNLQWQKLTTINGADLFDVSGVKTMASMFDSCCKLQTLDISAWNTGNVTNMFGMFDGCSAIKKLNFNSDNWDTSNVQKMNYMFYNCTSLTELDLRGFQTSKVTTMAGMFGKCPSLEKISFDSDSWNTSSVTDMSYMFSGCANLSKLDVSGFYTSKVNYMSSMFNGCSSLKKISVNTDGWDTSKVSDMSYMFDGCSGLTELDVSRFQTGNVIKMNSMFRDCSLLEKLSVNTDGWDTSKVTTMGFMFYNCSNLSLLDVSRFQTGNVTTMQQMFSGCSSLKVLDVSSDTWDTSKVEDMRFMFYNCSELDGLDLSNWQLNENLDTSSMFGGTRWSSEPLISAEGSGTLKKQ